MVLLKYSMVLPVAFPLLVWILDRLPLSLEKLNQMSALYFYSVNNPLSAARPLNTCLHSPSVHFSYHLLSQKFRWQSTFISVATERLWGFLILRKLLLLMWDKVVITQDYKICLFVHLYKMMDSNFIHFPHSKMLLKILVTITTRTIFNWLYLAI